MKPEIKQKWIDALRSGKYTQNTGRLRKNDDFCCLGVLCDIVKDDLGINWDCITTTDDESTYYVISRTHDYLPGRVSEYVDIKSRYGNFQGSQVLSDYLDAIKNDVTKFDDLMAAENLAELNDAGADIIEEKF